MSRPLTIAASLLLMATSTAHAQQAVIDIANLFNTGQSVAQGATAAAHRLQQINNQITQIIQLKNTLDAVAHGNVAAMGDLVSELGYSGQMQPLGETGEAISALMNLAGTAGATASLGQDLLRTDQFYAPTSPDIRAVVMNQMAGNIAMHKVLAQQAYESAGRRLTLLTDLRDKLSTTADIKASADATARLTGESAVAQAQTNQLLALGQMSRAQAATNDAREQQMWRCSAEALVAQARSTATAASSGTIALTSGAAANCGSAPLVLASASTDQTGTMTDATSGSSVGAASNFSQYLGQPVGTGQCVALVQATSNVGQTATWRQGDQVQGDTNLAVGTPIATFDSNGRYANATDGSSHAAIYLGQNAQGIQVEDQWAGQPAQQRTIAWNSLNGAANTGSAFYVVSH